MKKILLGTSAIAMAGAYAGDAKAATWDLDWGGFFNAYGAFTSEDDFDGKDGFDILTNAEIIFTPSITLDNGLTFGAKLELEGGALAGVKDEKADIFDESVAFVRGSFGRIELGAEDSAFSRTFRGGGQAYTRGAFGIYSGTMTGTFMGGSYGAQGNDAQIAGDAVRINYFTPRFAGFQLGASYARGTSKVDRFFENTDTEVSDVFSVGANYVNDFGGVDLALSGGYETADEPGGGDDPEQYHAGIALGVAGFTLGAAYAHYEHSDVDFFDIGAAYDIGPWGMSLGYTFDDGGDEVSQIAAGVQYDLGPGVQLQGSVGWVDNDAQDIDGFTVGTGFALSF